MSRSDSKSDDLAARKHINERLQAFLENVDDRPYWQWVAVMDPSTCDVCKSLNGNVYHYADPIWKHRLPPIHKGCRCRFRALSKRNLAERNLAITTSSVVEEDNKHTNENSESIPEKKCPFCAMMIPGEALVCPHCRKNQVVILGKGGNPKLFSPVGIALIIILLFAAAVVIFGRIDKGGENAPQIHAGQKLPDKVDAHYISQDLVKAFLKTPATAKFPMSYDVNIIELNKGSFQVNSYVDAQNDFGAMVRYHYIWIGSYDSGVKKWATEYLKFDNNVLIDTINKPI